MKPRAIPVTLTNSAPNSQANKKEDALSAQRGKAATKGIGITPAKTPGKI
jgi:hypothetical protein